MKEVFIYDALRTPIGHGTSTGSLLELRPIDLLEKCLRTLQQRNQLDTSLVSDFILGCSISEAGQANNLAKTALAFADWDASVPGVQINRYQSSGLDAVTMGVATIRAGLASLIVAGGTESMSRVRRSENQHIIINEPDIIHAIHAIPVGLAADLMATLQGYEQVQLNEYALKSIKKARQAQKKKWFEQSVVPIFDKNNIPILEIDETIPEEIPELPETPATGIFPFTGQQGFQVLALKKYPLVERIIALHTRFNCAAPADAAALMLLGNKEDGDKIDSPPKAKIIAASTTGTDLTLMHKGAVAVARKLLTNSGLKSEDIDLWMVNESFAAPALFFQKSFKIPDNRFNSAGGNIAFGESPGANGIILLGMLADELKRLGKQRGLLAISAEGGMGTGVIIENC